MVETTYDKNEGRVLYCSLNRSTDSVHSNPTDSKQLICATLRTKDDTKVEMTYIKAIQDFVLSLPFSPALLLTHKLPPLGKYTSYC